MKTKKYIFIFVFVILLILLFLYFFTNIFTSSKEIVEYTPQEEISESEIRKTIVYLYFKNIETNSLIAEAKCIDSKDLFENPYKYLINLLIAGPNDEKLESTIPEGTIINSCELKGDTVYIDFSTEFILNAPAGLNEEKLIISSILKTLSELNEVSSIKILINGEENLQFKDGFINFKENFNLSAIS